MGIMARVINDGVRSDPDTSYLKERERKFRGYLTRV